MFDENLKMLPINISLSNWNIEAFEIIKQNEQNARKYYAMRSLRDLVSFKISLVMYPRYFGICIFKMQVLS